MDLPIFLSALQSPSPAIITLISYGLHRTGPGPPTCGGACDNGDHDHLHRLIKWSENGFTSDSEPKYAKDSAMWAGLEGH